MAWMIYELGGLISGRMRYFLWLKHPAGVHPFSSS